MLAAPHEDAPRKARQSPIFAQPQAQKGFKGLSPTNIPYKDFLKEPS